MASWTFHKLHVLGMNDDFWDRVCGLGSETWKGCHWMRHDVVMRIALLELYSYLYFQALTCSSD